MEAIAFGAAASAERLGNEFLFSRRIRMTDPKFMKSGFEKGSKQLDIKAEFESIDELLHPLKLNVFEKEGEWKEVQSGIISRLLKNNEISAPSDSSELKNNELNESSVLPIRYINALADYLKRERFIDVTQISKFLLFAPENTPLQKFEERVKSYH